jgi:hypothetical protein
MVKHQGYQPLYDTPETAHNHNGLKNILAICAEFCFEYRALEFSVPEQTEQGQERVECLRI